MNIHYSMSMSEDYKKSTSAMSDSVPVKMQVPESHVRGASGVGILEEQHAHYLVAARNPGSKMEPEMESQGRKTMAFLRILKSHKCHRSFETGRRSWVLRDFMRFLRSSPNSSQCLESCYFSSPKPKNNSTSRAY